MKKYCLAVLPFFLLFLSAISNAQAWSGLLNPVGSGSCTGISSGTACGANWSTAGIPGGVPSASWTQSGSTIAASACSNGSSDCTSTIQAALNSCGGKAAAGKYVLLGPGTFQINGTLTLGVGASGNYCELRGSGANQTILNIGGSSGPPIALGNQSGITASNIVNITGGANGGSTTLTLSSTSGITAGTSYLVVSALNDPSFVNITGDFGSCTWCYLVYGWGGGGGEGRTRGQIVAVTAVSGSTVTVSPALYAIYSETLPGWAASTNYGYYAYITNGGHYYQQTVNGSSSPYYCTTGGSAPAFSPGGGCSPDGTWAWQVMGAGTTAMAQAVPFTPGGLDVGVMNLQTYANNTRTSGNLAAEWVSDCAYCWVKGIENNYADGDHVQVYQSFGVEVRDSYFSGSYRHQPGTYDSNVDVAEGTSASKVENNIFERLHTSLMIEWGASGNVFGYNYSVGDFDSGSYNWVIADFDEHGAHTEYNLLEGNVMAGVNFDSGWGSNSNNTTFRNWMLGTTMICTPLSGRGTVNCTPGYPTPGQGYYEYQESNAFLYGYLSSGMNTIGDVAGSSAQASLCLNGGNPGASCASPMPQIDTVIAACPTGITTHCGANSKGYSAQATGWAWGYGTSNDGGGGPFDSATPYDTRFVHGVYSNLSGKATFATGITTTLPPSFYLTGTPSWWGSVPYPAIGPDVTGGIGPGGHAYAIPAEVCYQSMGGANGTGSPLTFNPATCYGGSTVAPAPPTSLTGTVTTTP